MHVLPRSFPTGRSSELTRGARALSAQRSAQRQERRDVLAETQRCREMALAAQEAVSLGHAPALAQGKPACERSDGIALAENDQNVRRIDDGPVDGLHPISEDSRVGNRCGSTCRSRWSP